jgi:hypothetical protein
MRDSRRRGSLSVDTLVAQPLFEFGYLTATVDMTTSSPKLTITFKAPDGKDDARHGDGGPQHQPHRERRRARSGAGG